MTYRFAQAAFLSACISVLGDHCPRRGELKYLLRHHIEHWLAQPIFDNGGVRKETAMGTCDDHP